jgi:hypothetical protein
MEISATMSKTPPKTFTRDNIHSGLISLSDQDRLSQVQEQSQAKHSFIFVRCTHPESSVGSRIALVLCYFGIEHSALQSAQEWK